MRVLFYPRPWTVDLYLAVEDHWRRGGDGIAVRYITQHQETVGQLRRAGRDALYLPEEVRREQVGDPREVLESFEERHEAVTVPLMRMLMAERYFSRRPRAWQFEQLAKYVTVLERLFADFRPQLMVGDLVDLMPVWLAHEIAPVFGCQPVGLAPSTLPAARLLMLEGHTRVPGSRERYEVLRGRGLGAGEVAGAQELQATVRGEGTRIDYLATHRDWGDLLRRFLNGGLIVRHGGFVIQQWRERLSGNWFVQPNPILEAGLRPFRSLRARIADSRLVADALPQRPFVFFPLHYEPEANLLVHGSYFENQLEVVRNLARSLPVGWDLVVKEHPQMRGRRDLGFYRRLRRVPNVRLVPAAVRSNVLIKHARMVAVISGTPGLEASLLGKPVIMFGDFPWDYAPTVHRVRALSDLPALIRAAADAELAPDHPDVLAFGASWDASLPRGRYYRHRGYDWLEPANVEQIADALQQVIDRPEQDLLSPVP